MGIVLMIENHSGRMTVKEEGGGTMMLNHDEKNIIIRSKTFMNL